MNPSTPESGWKSATPGIVCALEIVWTILPEIAGDLQKMVAHPDIPIHFLVETS